MVRRLWPAVPRFDGRALLVDGNIEAHARHMIMSVCFHPWVTHASSTSEAVPHVTNHSAFRLIIGRACAAGK